MRTPGETAPFRKNSRGKVPEAGEHVMCWADMELRDGPEWESRLRLAFAGHLKWCGFAAEWPWRVLSRMAGTYDS